MATLAVISDAHTNSKVGLFPPNFVDDDGIIHHQNLIQQWIWDCWTDYWLSVKYELIKLDDELYVVFVGDLVDGDHHGTPQIITKNTADQAKIAFACLQPMLDLKPSYTFVIRGTEAHVGQTAQDEETIAWFLSNITNVERQPETGTYSWYFLPMEVEGVKFDIAHHGRGGFLPWTRHGATQRYAASLMFKYFGKEWYPDIAIRAHNHYKSETADNFPIRLFYLPSWQQSTSFGHRIDAGARRLQAGGLIFKCENGEYNVIKKTYDPPPDEVWRKDDRPTGQRQYNNGESFIAGMGKNISRIWNRPGGGDDES